MKETLCESYQASTTVFLPIEGPNDLNGRYLTEDVPCSLVAMVEVARLAGVSTPVMDSVVILASTLKSENYLESGRTLEKMGLNGMTIDEIKDLLQNGYR